MFEKLLLFAHREGFPLGCRIHKGLEAVAQLQQVVVGVEVFDLFGQAAHQRRLPRHAHVVGELAVELIELIPEAAVALHALGQAVHGELGLAQGMGKLGGVIDRLVQMPVFAIPVPLPPLANPDRHVTAGGRAGRHRPHQIADDLLVDQAEVIQLDQLAEIPLGQILLNAEDLGAFSREGLESAFELTAVFPALEKHHGVAGQFHLAVGAHGVA